MPPDVDPELVKRLAELVDGDGWEVADLLAERFPPEEYGEAGKSANTELHAELDAASDALRRDHGVELTVATMRNYRSTALAWPRADRPARASFDAHARLRGADGHDRMQRYLKRNKGRSLSRRDVQRYRADDNPKPTKPWDQQARQRIHSTVRSLLLGSIVTKRDDWWNVGGAEARAALAAMLRQLANRMEGGAA